MGRKVKEYLCNICGESDRDNFYGISKGICKICQKEQVARYRMYNKERVKECNNRYRINNADILREKANKKYQDNIEISRDSKRNYIKNRRDSNTYLRVIDSLRSRHNKVLKGKASTTKGLGCTSKELVSYIESQFQEGMTLENYGIVWELDHKIPMSTAELNEKGEFQDSEYNRKLIYYKNLQPLTIEENRLKSDKILDHHLEEFNSEDYFDK